MSHRDTGIAKEMFVTHMQLGFKRTFFTLNHKTSLLLPSFKAASYDYPPRFQSKQNCPCPTLKCLRTFFWLAADGTELSCKPYFVKCEHGLLLTGYYLAGKDFIQERQEVQGKMCFTSWPPCTMAEVWSKETLCTNLSSDGTGLYLWFARKISTLRLTGAQLIIRDNISPQQV